MSSFHKQKGMKLEVNEIRNRRWACGVWEKGRVWNEMERSMIYKGLQAAEEAERARCKKENLFEATPTSDIRYLREIVVQTCRVSVCCRPILGY